MKEYFKKFLNSRGLSKNTINNYSSHINTLSKEINKKLYLVSEDEIANLEKISEELSYGSLKEIGAGKNSGNRNSMKYYVDFRKHMRDYPNSYESKGKSANEQLVEDILEANFSNLDLFKDFVLIERQYKNGTKKVDMLLEHRNENLRIVIELKDRPIIPEHISQIVNYINNLESKDSEIKYKGILIGHSITDGAKNFYNKNIQNCDLEFYSFNLKIDLDKLAD